tara:strand:+ start:227 stop:670 length:444 start_codon:yes stop_codon:yes gene_type:complete
MSKINYFFEDTTSNNLILPNKSWIESSIVMEGRNLGCINFIICSDNYLVKINKKYLNKEYLTDVITFNTNHLANFESKDYIYGDIYISIERVLENKKNYGVSISNELHRVLIHGVLHLLGYDDKTKSEKKLMTSKEDEYLKMIKENE